MEAPPDDLWDTENTDPIPAGKHSRGPLPPPVIDYSRLPGAHRGAAAAPVKITKHERAGFASVIGALATIIGIVIAMAVHLIAGVGLALAGIILAVIGTKKWHACSACGNQVAPSSRICPACRAPLRPR